MVSEIFDPSQWTDMPGFDGLTDAHLSPFDGWAERSASRSTAPSARKRLPPPHGGRASYRTLRACPAPRPGWVASCYRERPVAKDGGWAFSSPAAISGIRGRTGYQYEGGGGGDRTPPRPGSAAHPGGAASDPLHTQGRDRRGAGVGRGGRALPPRRLRPHPGDGNTPASKQNRSRRRELRQRYGSAYLARMVGDKKRAREIFFPSASTTPRRGPCVWGW